MSARHGRLSKLEAERAEWKKKNIPLAEMFFYLEHMLQIVQEEAGQPTMSRIAGRMIGEKLRRVDVLSRGQR